MDADHHIALKRGSYWEAMETRPTTAYNRDSILELVAKHGPRSPQRILDVGCGSGHILQLMKDCYPQARLFGLDYDPAAIQRARGLWGHIAEFIQGDIFAMSSLGSRYDLIIFCDILHEVYSFRARTGDGSVDPVEGNRIVSEALAAAIAATSDGGAIIITDSLLPELDRPVRCRARSREVLAAVERLVAEYPSRPIRASLDGDVIATTERDLSTVLTQYNKLKNNDMARWNVERLEVHQYWSVSQFKAFFQSAGLEAVVMTATPSATHAEWSGDFEILDGLDDFPTRRVTVLAEQPSQR